MSLRISFISATVIVLSSRTLANTFSLSILIYSQYISDWTGTQDAAPFEPTDSVIKLKPISTTVPFHEGSSDISINTVVS